MESQPQNPEFRNYPENFHPWHSQFGKPLLLISGRHENNSYFLTETRIEFIVFFSFSNN